MNRNVLLTIAAVAVLAVGGGLFYVFGAGTAETSVDVEDVVADPVAVPDDTAVDGTTPPEPAEPGDGTTYAVDQAASLVTYEIDELLRGEPVTVVGFTSEVATRVVVDPADPASLAFGQVAVNARTFATDQSSRDSAVRGRILETDDPANELIVFTPTSTSTLPDDISAAFTVDVTGDLTISGSTTEVTFPLTVTPEGDDYRLAGETTVSRADYGLTIPSVPFVADVGDDVVLTIDLLLVAETA
jgi:polyisoprenoid-binding protein YceI